VQATTEDRVELALRLDGIGPEGRLRPSRVHAGMPFAIRLGSAKEYDADARGWLRRAYRENS